MDSSGRWSRGLDKAVSGILIMLKGLNKEFCHPEGGRSWPVAPPHWREPVEEIWKSDQTASWEPPFGGFLSMSHEKQTLKIPLGTIYIYILGIKFKSPWGALLAVFRTPNLLFLCSSYYSVCLSLIIEYGNFINSHNCLYNSMHYSSCDFAQLLVVSLDLLVHTLQLCDTVSTTWQTFLIDANSCAFF